MGTRSKSDENVRCTKRGSCRMRGRILDEAISIVEGHQASNHQGRRDAWKKVRIATKATIKQGHGDITATQEHLIRRYGRIVNNIYKIVEA